VAGFKISLSNTAPRHFGLITGSYNPAKTRNFESITLRTDSRIHLTNDDPDDRLLIQEAMFEAEVEIPLDCTVDGQDLMDDLKREGAYSCATASPIPDLILLDLNMPRKDARQSIQEIRA
jgi:CheY-like chemotaxis protein